MRDGLLLVRHGPPQQAGMIPYMQPALDRLAARRPELAARIRHHELGVDAPAPDLDDLRAVVFWLRDPLRETLPDAYAEARAIADAAAARGLRVGNHPDALSHTVKSVQATRWLAAGLATPAVVAAATGADVRAAAARVGYPLIVRGDHHHAQSGMAVIRSAAGLARALRRGLPLPAAVSPFVDVRAAWRRTRPDALEARLHHKGRAMVAGDTVRTVHLFYGGDPIVSMLRSVFRDIEKPRKRPLRWLRHRRDHARALHADLAAFDAPPPDPGLMIRATRTLDLDWAAIDYSAMPDGTLMLWEANPHFRLLRWHDITLAGRRDMERRHASLHDTTADWLASLIDAP